MSKKGWYILIVLVLAVVIIFFITGNLDNTKEVSEVVDSAYYVEANGNVFIMIAKLCDDACYYLISGILSAVEKIFGTLLG